MAEKRALEIKKCHVQIEQFTAMVLCPTFQLSHGSFLDGNELQLELKEWGLQKKVDIKTYWLHN